MFQGNALAAAVALVWAGHAAAQPFAGGDEEDLALAYGGKDVVSIATGSRQPVRKAPSVASVITAEDIAAMGAVDVDDVLETVPGMHVYRSSIRYASAYVVRGIGAGQTNPQVLVLVNGVPATTMFNGDKGLAWRGTPVENISRIEVIRGPGSALYGADAYAGVINIITKTAREAPGTETGLRTGSYRAWDAWIQHGGNLGPVEVAGYLRLGSSEGSRGRLEADAQTRNDQRFNTSASLAPGSLNNSFDAIDGSLDLGWGQWRLRSNYKLRDHLGTGAGINSALVPGSEGRAEVVNNQLSWTDPQFTRDWGLGFLASHQYYSLTYPDNLMLLPPGAQVGSQVFPAGMIGGPNYWEKQFRLSAFATYGGFSGHKLRIGLGHDDLDLYRTRTYKNYLLAPNGAPLYQGGVRDYSDIQPFIRPQRRSVSYVYIQDEWQLARDWTLTAGLRHDGYSDFGATTNPRLALVWEAAHDLTAKVLYGEAFRAPSFNEQYGLNPVAAGNSGLKPETIRSLEAAFSWQARRDTQVNVSLFHYEAEAMIRLVNNLYQNAGIQHGRGLELELAWEASRSLRLSGNYGYQRSTDEATGRDPGYAPRHHAYARADWRFVPGWQVHAQVNYVGDRRREAGDNRSPVADYTTMDVTLRTEAQKKGWDFAASVRNLFNADAREPTFYAPVAGRPDLAGSPIPGDLPLPRRSFWLQARHTL